MELQGWKKYAVYLLIAIFGGMALSVNGDARKRKEQQIRYDDCMKSKDATVEVCKKAALR